MRQFATLYPELIPAQPVSQLPWGHIIVLMQQVKDPEAREWYANNTLKNGIARSVLIRSFSIKKGDSFIFDSHRIEKIENTGQTRLAMILGKEKPLNKLPKSSNYLT